MDEGDEMVEHDQSHWCWCRPRITNEGWMMLITHRDIEPPRWLAGRRTAGGEEYEDSGCAARWQHLYP